MQEAITFRCPREMDGVHRVAVQRLLFLYQQGKEGKTKGADQKSSSSGSNDGQDQRLFCLLCDNKNKSKRRKPQLCGNDE